MLVKQSNERVEYEIASRLKIGGRVYYPKQRVTLDSSEGKVLLQRGFVKPVVAAKKETKDEPIPAEQIGVVTKGEEEQVTSNGNRSRKHR